MKSTLGEISNSKKTRQIGHCAKKHTKPRSIRPSVNVHSLVQALVKSTSLLCPQPILFDLLAAFSEEYIERFAPLRKMITIHSTIAN